MKAYREKVHFVVIDPDVPRSREQQQLVKEITRATFLTSRCSVRAARPSTINRAKSTPNTFEDIFRKSLGEWIRFSTPA